MDLKKIWSKVTKPVVTTAVVMLMLLLFVLLTGQDTVSPNNPMDEKEADASMMYLTSSTLAMDETLLEGVANANISSGTGDGDEQDQIEMEEPEITPEEQPEEPEQPEEIENPEDQPTTPPENSQPEDSDIPPAMDSLISLIQKNETSEPEEIPDPEGDISDNGTEVEGPSEELIPGSSGQQATLDPEESNELFTTSIQDGERVNDPNYSFTISLTAKGRAQNLISQMVIVNGTSKSFTNGDSVTLKEGANSIVVTLRFRDKNYNQIDAPTKSYTVYYVPENRFFLQVQNADTGEYYEDGMSLDVTEQELALKVIAMKSDGETSARLRLNNATVSVGEDGIYRMNLKVGTNTIRATAGTGQNQQVITFTLNYQPGVFTLSMESEAVTEKIQGDRFGSYTYAEYASASESFVFRVSCSRTTGLEQITSIAVTTHIGTTEMVHMAGANGYIQCDLDATQITEIKVTCVDSEGATKYYTWQIKFVRSGETPENKKPIIQTNLAEGEVLKSSPYILTVHAKDYMGKQLYPTQMQVIINGQSVEYSGISGIAYEYILNLQEGKNVLQIIATDTEQYRAAKEISFIYDAVVENVDVTLIVDANTLALGTFIQENIAVPSNTTIAQFLEERLIANGYTPAHLGSTTGDYYLQSIAKPGILNNWYVSQERIDTLIAEGYGFAPPDDVNKLGEYDFSQGSGWMITLNGYFIGMGMGTRPVRDGDMIRVQFTLDIGGDVGVDPSGGIYG